MVKALRGGVQDVAVKQLLHTNAAAVEKFLEVSQPNEANHISPLFQTAPALQLPAVE